MDAASSLPPYMHPPIDQAPKAIRVELRLVLGTAIVSSASVMSHGGEAA